MKNNDHKEDPKREASKSEPVFDQPILANEATKIDLDSVDYQKQLDSLFELTNDAIFLIDLKGYYLKVNQKAVELLGYQSKEELIGVHMTTFIPKDEQYKSKEQLKKLLNGERLPIYRRRFLRPDGSTFTAEINASLVWDRNGNPLYIQSVIRDISDRRKIIDKINLERRIFHSIAEANAIATNIPDLCQILLIGLTTALDFSTGFVFLYNEKKDILENTAEINKEGLNLLDRIDVVSRKDPNYILSLVAREKKAIFYSIDDQRKNIKLKPFSERIQESNIKALITWPILGEKENLLGVMQLIDYKTKELLEKDRSFFATVARLFGNALEQKKADEALKMSEQKYRSFAEHFQGIAYQTTKNWKPLFFNGAVKEITGYTETDLKNWNSRWEDIVHPEDKKYVLQNEKDLIEEKIDKCQIEYRIIRKDGQVRWVSEVNYLIENEIGEIDRVQGEIYDITERKRSERFIELQRNLAINLSTKDKWTDALSLILTTLSKFDVINGGIFYLVDEETADFILEAEKNTPKQLSEKLTVLTTDSPLTKSILSGKPVYDEFSNILNVLDLAKMPNFEYKGLAILPVFYEDKIEAILVLLSKTINLIPMNTRIALELIASQIGGVLTRIRTQEALRESEERFRSFVQNFTGIAYKMTKDWKPIFLHGAVKEITGYNKFELSQNNPEWEKLIHPYDLDDVKTATENAIISNDSILKLDYRIITKKGDIRWVQDISQINYGEESGPFFQGIILNITERKKAQEQLKKLYDELENRVAERTEELLATNKELTTFSYSVSHDLRSPLRHVSGFADLLLKRAEVANNLDEKIISYAKKIKESTEKMNELIEGLLHFSRMSRKEMVRISIDMNELVKNVLKEFQIEIDSRNIEIITSNLPNVYGDPSLLRIVIRNLLSNAIKFTKTKEEPIIEIKTKPAKSRDKVTICVRDNGIGFDMRYYDRLFGVFQRLHKDEDFEGTGIGLATVQRIIRRMHGNIWAEGEIDKGSTFYFSLPKAPQ